MVESNKILTVSYGTFSCTLEGFDDSFGTMKAIAEYFRDLAAGDRYFGAEPPIPDAEMLTRIAEREITRRVEARMESSGLVLRATGAIGSDDSDSGRAPARPAMPSITPARPVVHAPAPTEMADTPVLDQIADSSVSEPEASAFGSEDSDGPGALLLAASGPSTVLEGGVPDFAVQAPDEPIARPGRTIRVAPAHPDADSVAAKLQRIRAVVGRTSTGVAAATTADYVEDLNIAPVVAAPVATMQTDDDSLLSRFVQDDAVVSEPAPVGDDAIDTSADDFDLDAFLGAVNDTTTAPDAQNIDGLDDGYFEDLTETDTLEVEAPGATEAEPMVAEPDSMDLGLADFVEGSQKETVEPAPAPIRARVIRMKRNEFDDAIALGRIEEDLPDANLPADNVAMLDGIDDLEHFAGLSDETSLDQDAENDLLLELAEVEREIAAASQTTSRARPVAAPQNAAEIDLFDDEDSDFVDEDEEEDFDDEDEDDLDLDSDFDLSDGLEDAPVRAPAAEAVTPVRPDRPGRALLDRHPEADEAALSRILSKTDDQLNEPESNRRRAAISQLKAAVAATEAARRMGEPNDTEDDAENAFRDDLSQVVRPRRAEIADRRTERPRPAPLKLVASQRIDVATPVETRPAAPVLPVRPRRVAVEDAPAASVQATPANATVGSFADFAEEMGARNLGELLEAAAAYTSFVEGLQDFSRPQLMKKVREAAGDDFSREDGLRSFGTLLRQGRIEKINSGRFQISEQTRYRPETRAARG